jgi:hypothetical protein
MSEEEKSKKPKFVIPDSGKEKSSNRLLVPQEDSSSEAKESKLNLVTGNTQDPSEYGDDLQNVLPSNENIQPDSAPEFMPQSNNVGSEVEESVKVVAMTPPTIEEEVIGELPQQDENNWMKEAYEQVENADRINEEIVNSQEDHLEDSVVNQISQDYASGQESLQNVQQPVVQQPVAQVPDIHQTPQAPPLAQAGQYNQPYPPQAYPTMQQQQGYYQQPQYVNYQNKMMPPQEQQFQVPSKSGLPGWVYFLLGACIGAIVMVVLFAKGPQSFAESLRPDLVEKGKNLVIIDGVPQGEVKK